MRKKILFWLGTDFTHYCLSYYLQKMVDADFYAIIDITNKPKTFLQNQELVEFKKTWFFHDHISPKNKIPDTEFLKKIEHEYELNIWKLILNERIFYNFFNFHDFTYDEVLSIEEQSCKLFENILNDIKPDYLITKQPAFHHLELFYQMCKKKGVQVLMLNNSNFGESSIIVEDISKFDDSLSLEQFESDTKSLDKTLEFQQSLKKNIQKNLLNRKKPLDYIKSSLEFIFSKNINVNTNYNYYGRTKFNVLKNELEYNINLRSRKNFIDSNLNRNPNINSKFIFFPMSLDMERSTLIDAPFYTNQIEVIRSLAKSIPIEYKLFVKEHPSQFLRGWRKISDYKILENIPNVELIHPNFSQDTLLKNCNLAITIGGTAGFEAALHSKPSIIFNDLRYSILPSVYRLKSLEELPQIIRKWLNVKVDQNDVSKYVNLLNSVTFDFNWLEFQQFFQNEFQNNDTSRDVLISESRMKIFLEKHKNILESLASEHIKKMKDKNSE